MNPLNWVKVFEKKTDEFTLLKKTKINDFYLEFILRSMIQSKSDLIYKIKQLKSPASRRNRET
jgi:hypothetical protein